MKFIYEIDVLGEAFLVTIESIVTGTSFIWMIFALPSFFRELFTPGDLIQEYF